MRFSRREFLAGAAVLAAASAVPTWLLSRPDEPRADQRPEHVVLVDWDGFDPTYLYRTSTPNLDALAGRGSLSIAEGTFPTISNPSRGSMSTGAYPEVHGNAAYYLDRESGRVVGEERTLHAETVAERLADAGRTLASVQWYMVQDRGAAFGDPDRLYVEPGGLFGTRVDAAIDILERRPVDSGGRAVRVPEIPHFLAIYGSDLDDLGQVEGPDGPNVVPLLAEMDRQLGRLVQATRDASVYDRTAFIVTGDHGMTGWQRDLAPNILAAITAAGYIPEIVTPGDAPEPGTEIVVIPNAVRIANVALRGRAATSKGQQQVRAALEGVPHIAKVLDQTDLKELRASEKLDGILVVEAEEPWGFAPPGESGGGTRGAHGSTKEMRVPLLLSGTGFHRGAAPHNARLVDVTPTICALLGVRPPGDAQGRLLSESTGF
jgi:predicted AlkP superfamily pyrophosphatase or phosphodiesterase